ncbi:hypothetical protein GUF51_25965, partial [Xanthomonas citri pv. citri]|nr:hypothetical protein [Xanthomonas citri pv. citri]
MKLAARAAKENILALPHAVLCLTNTCTDKERITNAIMIRFLKERGEQVKGHPNKVELYKAVTLLGAPPTSRAVR